MGGVWNEREKETNSGSASTRHFWCCAAHQLVKATQEAFQEIQRVDIGSVGNPLPICQTLSL